jgi:signal transduction histidine kinase
MAAAGRLGYKESRRMTSAQEYAGDNPARRRRRWALGAFFAGWTVLVILAVWWVFRPETASASAFVISHDGGAARPWAIRFREWFELVQVNFYWAWGWLMLSPYVIWLGSRFHLEKGRWLPRLPVLVLVGIGFVWGSRAVTRQAAGEQNLVVVAPRMMVQQTGNDAGFVKRIVISQGGVHAGRTNLMVPQFFEPPVVTLSNLADGLPPEFEQMLSNASQRLYVRHSGNLPSAFGPTVTNLWAGQMAAETLAAAVASNLVPVLQESFRTVTPRPQGWFRLPASAGLDTLAYLALLGVAHAGRLHRRYREREQQAVVLSAQLNQARLRALQAQLQPHFLFNALNGIATLVRRDPAAAHDMLTSLSELLRLALSQSERQQIPLREEMRFLDRYIEIQQMRFGDRLRVERELEPAALESLVPALLLQPLVENALRHGIEPSPLPGVLRLTAALRGGTVELRVEDNGAGLPLPSAGGTGTLKFGVGLASVRERFESLYPGQYEFELTPRPEGGVCAYIRLPFRAAPAEPVPPPESR